MIAYAPDSAPAVRAGEADLAGRRLAGRLLPYVGEWLATRFDPVDRRFASPRLSGDGAILSGPHDPEAWRQAAARLPAGPLLVGPCAPGEILWGAHRAAAEGALAAGRAIFLLDPEPAGLPENAGAAAVVVASWRPGPADEAFPALRVAREAGLAAAAVLPLIPGWTDEPDTAEALVAAAARGGAASASAVLPHGDGETRRGIVEARGGGEDDGPALFDRVHHADWSALAARVAGVRDAAARHGLAVLPPRPAGRRGGACNGAAAARLEERAELADGDEHRVALLLAAVRWIDESPRDLAAVAREGNFRKVFPFGADVAAEAEAALLGTP